jgi:hypothetical protein
MARGPVAVAARAAVASAAAVTAGVQATVGLLSLFREDVEFKGVATKVDRLAFELLVAAAVKAWRPRAVFVPDLAVATPVASSASTLSVRWEDVQRARRDAWKSAAPLITDLAEKEAALEAAVQSGTPLAVAAASADLTRFRRQAEPVTELLGNADRRLADLQARWNQTDPHTGVSLLARLLRAESLDELSPLYVHAAIVSSGGHNRVSRNLFRMLFFGDGLSAMGGAIARWGIIASDGSVRDGGAFSSRLGARFPVAMFDSDIA